METNTQKFNIALGLAVIIVIGLVLYFATKGIRTNQLPAEVILHVPFSTQAPSDNWNRNEDCEETSITMANSFLSGNNSNELTPDEAQKAINNLKIWEQANLGYNKDTGADATVKLAEGAFAIKTKEILNFTEGDLKKELANNHPILLPINGKLLKGQQYRNEGPTYHMIVLRGYHNGKFILNDPGTNAGNGNEFSFTALHDAAADWNNASKSMDPNRKIAIALWK
ncbi:MAG TPA: C39 family peptidase [Patescibacteria group bacterium]|jgi:hypothetical protein|nr:C39 family peptidase [Patescibacteria group bacterium]